MLDASSPPDFVFAKARRNWSMASAEVGVALQNFYTVTSLLPKGAFLFFLIV